MRVGPLSLRLPEPPPLSGPAGQQGPLMEASPGGPESGPGPSASETSPRDPIDRRPGRTGFVWPTRTGFASHQSPEMNDGQKTMGELGKREPSEVLPNAPILTIDHRPSTIIRGRGAKPTGFVLQIGLVLALAGAILILPPAALADTLDRVRASGHLGFGGDEEGGAPYFFRDADDRLVGFEADLMAEVAREIGVAADFHQAQWR